jgi:hypothetical protein
MSSLANHEYQRRGVPHTSQCRPHAHRSSSVCRIVQFVGRRGTYEVSCRACIASFAVAVRVQSRRASSCCCASANFAVARLRRRGKRRSTLSTTAAPPTTKKKSTNGSRASWPSHVSKASSAEPIFDSTANHAVPLQLPRAAPARTCSGVWKLARTRQ